MRFFLFLIATISIAADFSTSLGDAYPYSISAIATDQAGNTYIVGSRTLAVPATAFRIGTDGIVSGLQFGGSDVFVSKLDPNGKLLFTDTFAGKGTDRGIAIALDPSGNIYIAGTTTSTDFPLSNALQKQPNPSSGTGFIIKLTNDGSTILYSTYFGGTLGGTSISSLATDTKGNLYLTGTTTAADFPHTTGMPFGPIQQSVPPAISGAIIASISAAGDKILCSGALVGTALACSGGTDCSLRTTSGVGIAIDSLGNAYVAGNTNTTDLPTTSGVLSTQGLGAFVAKFKASGIGLSYLTYLGTGEVGGEDGFKADISAASSLSAIAVDAAGNAYLAGQTNDPEFPTTPGSYQTFFSGSSRSSGSPSGADEGFLAKVKPDGGAMVWATYVGRVDTPGYGTNTQSIAIDASGNVWATGITATSAFPNTHGWTTGDEFLVGLDATGSKLTYAALYPDGTVSQAVALDPSGLVHVAGANGFVSAIAPATPPTRRIFGLGNVVGSNLTARISPSEIISIYGPGIGPATAATAGPANGFYPKTLAGVQVTINGVSMPLLYASTNQINAVVPMGLAIGVAATIRVINGAWTSPTYPVWVVYSAPQAFPTVLNQDGTMNTQKNPAKSGSIATFYATGWQSDFSPLEDGQVATTAQDACLGNCYANSTIGTDFAVVYGGVAPGIVAGVTQFNVRIGTRIPASPSAIGVYLTVTGPSSVTQPLWIAP